MKWLYTFVLFFVLVGCSKVDTPDTPSGSKKHHSPVETTTDTAQLLSVAQALKASTGQEIFVEGYIVGCIQGLSLASAVFGEVTEPNSNLLLADRPEETSLNAVLPVRLEKNTNFRSALNLAAHPELLHCKCRIYGWCKTYFQVNGIYRIARVYLPEDSASDSTTIGGGNKPLPHEKTPVIIDREETLDGR